MDANLEELQAIEGTMKSISDLQEEMPDEDRVQNLNDTYNTLAGINRLQQEVDYNLEELNDVYNTLAGINRLMEEMEIPSLEKLNEIYAKLLALKEAQEDA